ncbi:MAG: excinuclease ABC subunit UvrB [Patescibacteria group bacterium]|nr:excinuclease ABC subunit UvrB [Patescibacteria group bacterium]
MSSIFKLESQYKPAGDQPEAISALVNGLKKGMDHQTLFGVTGSGKTFSMANVIAQYNKPVLVIAHNKTLAAQLAQEYQDFFPNHAVHYFVSYYDYYQPEAYVAATDTYIEKDAKINAEIDRLRHASTQALLTRRDVIIVASVSCIYGLGSPEDYEAQHLKLEVGQRYGRSELLRKLIQTHYTRTTADLSGGVFRAIGNRVEIMPPSGTEIYQLTIEGERIALIETIDAITRVIRDKPKSVFLFPAKHFITSKPKREAALKTIEQELGERLKQLEKEGSMLEAERLRRRTTYDLAMIREVGYTSGIENYSRHLSGRKPGSAPDTLLSYFPRRTPGVKDAPTPGVLPGEADFLTIVDESHVTLPQIGGMYAGDQSRKKTLIEYGFRLPSALDNRPLKFDEFLGRVGPIIYTSATPGEFEREHGKLPKGQIVEQVIRPTGLVDPEILVRPIVSADKYEGQVEDFIKEAKVAIEKGGRVLATTLTKKMAEDLSEFLKKQGIKAEYLHSEVKTLDRIKTLTAFRHGSEAGGHDCIVGVNLLREGLDLPEVTLIGILDADKEGFLRSEVALIQTIGRAARNVNGRVILYADQVTGSMANAIKETDRRRKKQLTYNKRHGITPQTITKNIKDITASIESEHEKTIKKLVALDKQLYGKKLFKVIKEKTRQMNAAVRELDFETAALLRDEIKALTAEG